MGTDGPKRPANLAKLNRAKGWILLLLPCTFSIFIYHSLLEKDSELNSLAAPKFLVFANRIYGSRYSFLLAKILNFAITLAGTDLPRSYLRLIKSSIVKTCKDPSKRYPLSINLVESTINLRPDQSSAHGWKFVCLLLTSFGFIRAGSIARSYCLEAALFEIDTGKASNRTLHLAAKGLIENRRFKEAVCFMHSHKTTFEPNSFGKVYWDYLALLNQTVPKNFNSKHIKNSIPDESSLQLISNKSISLVATGEINTLSGSDIDNHEVVARVKFQGLRIMPNPEFSGMRCDITFYTKDLVEKFENKAEKDGKFLEFLADVKLIVLKDKSLLKVGKTPSRNLKFWAPTFLTTATSGTLFLFDILSYQPKVVKLFGFNFYSHRQIYNSELLNLYQNSEELSGVGLPKKWFDLSSPQRASATIAKTFISSDPRSDFLLVKNLYELSGLIDGTPEVLEILNLTADEYDARLEEMLGDW